MEKVWEELKKIEGQAEQVRSEAQKNAKEITSLSRQEADKLLENSKNYAQQEAQQLYTDKIDEAKHDRDQQLKVNQETTEKLVEQAKQRIETATSKIVAAVLGET
jgi:vacuolar-type H+-ATPase subunit H